MHHPNEGLSTREITPQIKLIAYLLVSGFLYLALVASDYTLVSYLKYSQGIIEKVKEIENSRESSQDYGMIKEARSLGLKSMFYPGLFDEDKEFLAIAERYGVAPLAPTPNQRLYYCNEGYGQVRYKSDRFGFRNDDSVWDSNKIDLILIGDSFTQGACVGENDTIAGSLSKKIVTINLATGGNSPIHYAALSKIFIPVIAAKNVVVIFYPNDNIDDTKSIYRKYFIDNTVNYFNKVSNNNKPEELSDSLISLYTEAQALADKKAVANLIKILERSQHKQNSVEENGVNFRASLKLKTIRRVVSNWIKINFHKFELPYSSKVAVDILEQECKKEGCSPIIAYIPNSPFWRPDPYAHQYSTALQQYSESRNIKFIDLSNDIANAGLSAYAIKGPHLSPKGYKLVADKIFSQLPHEN